MAVSTTKNSSRWKINECLMLRLTAFLFFFSSSHCNYITAAIGVGSNLTRRGGCIESEMLSLLALKEGIYRPPGNWLSSWRAGTDCCSWRGVGCDYSTGHIIKLNLTYPYDWIYNNEYYDSHTYEYYEDHLPGPSKLNSSLLGLMHLRHLDLSMNYFNPQPIPKFIGSLVKLEYLNLSNAGFGGSIPPHLGNLSSLRFLDLNSKNFYSYNYLRSGESLDWVSRMTSLEYLDMSGVDLSKARDNWIHDINMLPSLSVLLLSGARLEKIPYALPQANFTSLTTLDLSGNYFGSATPNWLFNITTLLHLDLGFCRFFGGVQISEVFGVHSRLQYLDLGNNKIITGDIQEWLGNFTDLVYLDLSFNTITGEIPKNIKNLSKLEVLRLSYNNIVGKIPETIGSLCKLNYLDLSNNRIGGQITGFVEELSRCVGGSNLQILHLEGNKLNGTIPTTFGQLLKLQVLILSSNSFVGNLTDAHFYNLSKLEVLRLSYNNIVGKIPETIGSLCKLNYLDLSNNMIRGQITGFVEELSRCAGGSNLQILHLEENKLNGTIPTTFGRLQKLQDLSLFSNSFVGNLTEVHFSNLPNLDWLDLSFNHFELIFSPSWIPPFNASLILMCSCHMGPRFPAWLRTQTRLESLCISEAGILENIPHWFWDIDITYLIVSYNQLSGRLPPSLETRKYYSLDLSSNSFDGQIPNLDPTHLRHIDLSNNSFSGPIPLCLANPMQAQLFSLSNNHLNGSIPPFYFYNFTFLQMLDLSNNNFDGRLPLFSSNDNSDLSIIDLSSNNFSGDIPDSIGYLLSLQSLHLRNNSLVGNIPWSLHHCKQLVVLDVGENKLSGKIPAWIGESLSPLRVLRLRSNSFSGNIPSQISFLTHLQVLDLAYNNLSGILSPSFWNFSAMFLTLNVNKPISYTSLYKENILLTTKGNEIMYTTVLSLVVSIDLSNNGLCGEIHEELTKLHGLLFLNLAKNHFTGKIPENIGAMRQLQSLDLSMNNLSGNIPPSISNLNFLECLNLSRNNLSGRIPSGGQLQSLDDPSIYSGNLNLCGWPLPQCPVDGPSQGPSIGGGGKDVQEHDTDKIWIYASTAVGFIIGFWSVIGTLMIKVSLRISIFHIIDRFYDWVYVKLAINIARIKSYGEV